MIIPVYNDAGRLRLCLEALEAQTLPRDQFEVIVVDNGSTDAVGGAFPRVRMLREPHPGSYNARNRGIACARGDVLAFTDADCIPEPAWLEAGLHGLIEHGEWGIVGGDVKVFAMDPARPTAAELYDILFALRQEASVLAESYAMTANMLTTKRVMQAVGPFDARLMSGGDSEWVRGLWNLASPAALSAKRP